jgi:two-component sensor histidine kinase
MSVDKAIPCGLIVNELVTNALKYAFPKDLTGLGKPVRSGCEIRVAFESQDDEYVLTVSDNGVGLPPDLDWRTAKSLGLQLVNIWATYQLGGSLKLDTQSGTAFKITFAERKNLERKKRS